VNDQDIELTDGHDLTVQGVSETSGLHGSELASEIQRKSEPLRRLITEVGRVIVGQEKLIQRMLVAMISGGHLLIEGVPGLAKTTAVASLAKAISTDFQRLQFTPDLLPADLIGTQIYRPQSQEFVVQKRAAVYQLGFGGRDQPCAGQGPKCAARSDAGATGHDRFRDFSAC